MFKAADRKARAWPMGTFWASHRQRIYEFPNGNRVSVVRGYGTYGSEERLFEAAYLLRDGVSEPEGWLSIMGVVRFLRAARSTRYGE